MRRGQKRRLGRVGDGENEGENEGGGMKEMEEVRTIERGDDKRWDC